MQRRPLHTIRAALSRNPRQRQQLIKELRPQTFPICDPPTWVFNRTLEDGHRLGDYSPYSGPGWRQLAQEVRDYLSSQGKYALEDAGLIKALDLLRYREMSADTAAQRQRARRDLEFALRGFHPPASVTCGRPTKPLPSNLKALIQRVLTIVREERRDRRCHADELIDRIARRLPLPKSEVEEVLFLLRPPLRRQRPRDAEVARILVSKMIGRGEESVKKVSSGPTKEELDHQERRLSQLTTRLLNIGLRIRA